MIKEFCAENLTDLHKVIGTDVTRVELCDNLAVGGTTPSYGVIKEANRYLHDHQLSSAVMIRPRGGDFVYNDIELRIMEEDILKAVELESDALVLGLLTADYQIDVEAIEHLLPATQGLPLVFHMAFDCIPQKVQKEALDTLITLGFSRVLLHGSPVRRDIFDNIPHIKDLMTYANGRIDLVLGGGVTADNYEALISQTGCSQVHGTNII